MNERIMEPYDVGIGSLFSQARDKQNMKTAFSGEKQVKRTDSESEKDIDHC